MLWTEALTLVPALPPAEGRLLLTQVTLPPSLEEALLLCQGMPLPSLFCLAKGPPEGVLLREGLKVLAGDGLGPL